MFFIISAGVIFLIFSADVGKNSLSSAEEVSTKKLLTLESCTSLKHGFDNELTLVTRKSTNGQSSTNLIVFLGRFYLQKFLGLAIKKY